jgi:hypothetical protein
MSERRLSAETVSRLLAVQKIGLLQEIQKGAGEMSFLAYFFGGCIVGYFVAIGLAAIGNPERFK